MLSLRLSNHPFCLGGGGWGSLTWIRVKRFSSLTSSRSYLTDFIPSLSSLWFLLIWSISLSRGFSSTLGWCNILNLATLPGYLKHQVSPFTSHNYNSPQLIPQISYLTSHSHLTCWWWYCSWPVCNRSHRPPLPIRRSCCWSRWPCWDSAGWGGQSRPSTGGSSVCSATETRRLPGGGHEVRQLNKLISWAFNRKRLI